MEDNYTEWDVALICLIQNFCLGISFVYIHICYPPSVWMHTAVHRLLGVTSNKASYSPPAAWIKSKEKTSTVNVTQMVTIWSCFFHIEILILASCYIHLCEDKYIYINICLFLVTAHVIRLHSNRCMQSMETTAFCLSRYFYKNLRISVLYTILCVFTDLMFILVNSKLLHAFW